MVNTKMVKKSCKLCLALAIGIIAGVALTKALDSGKGKDKEDCGCSR
jgi:hypothetical protein